MQASAAAGRDGPARPETACYWALGRGGIERTGLFQFLQPGSGVVLAWLLLGEVLTVRFIASSILILLGVWFEMKAK